MAAAAESHEFLDPPQKDGDLGTLGKYRVIDQLGKGGMGYVFRAEDSRLKRTVALKVMNKKIASTPGSRKRFISEARRAMAAVHHDNVATIFEVGEHNGTPYMAMEMLKGGTLEGVKKKSELPSYQELIRYAGDMIRGLAAAHANGIVHRDIKPANIWMEEGSDRIKILDFGLALANTPVDQLSGRGAVIGTPGYLSPEQARSEPVDDRSDLYSLGVVLYELATGKLPLQSKTVAEQLIAILAHRPRPVRDLNPEIPQPLADLIHRLLEKEPRDRYTSAAVLETELAKVAVECESKSEVAQAINKLQLGLDQVVSKKEGGVPALDALPTAAQPDPFASLPDPFAALPDAIAPATPAANGSGVAPAGSMAGAPVGSGGGISGVHAIPKAMNAGAAPRPTRPSNGSTSSDAVSSVKKFLPLIAVAAGALILIPVLIFVFSGGQPEGNRLVTSPGNPGANAPSPVANRPAPNPPATEPPARLSDTPPKPEPPKKNSQGNNRNSGNNKKKKGPPPAIEVSVPSIQSVLAQGAVSLIDPSNENGSFEQNRVRVEDDGIKVIPGWRVLVRGSDGGWMELGPQEASDGTSVAYAGADSLIELTGDSLKRSVALGDVLRLTYDVGGTGAGESHYITMLGFRGGGSNHRYRLDEFDDSSDVSQGLRTRGHLYTVNEKEAGKTPFVRFVVSNQGKQRDRAYLDNVQLTFQTAAVAASDTSPTPDPAMVASTPMVGSTNPPEAVPSGPATQETSSVPPADVTPTETLNTRRVTMRTSDEGGGDATVNKGTGVKKPLGESSRLAVQTRNSIQVQHAYLRFNLDDLRAGQSSEGKKKRPEIRLASSRLWLQFDMPQRPVGATIRVHGFDHPNSDRWTEKKLVWAYSVSDQGIESLPMLAETRVEPGGDNVLTLESQALTDFLATAENRTVTLILSGENGNAAVSFSSRENSEGEAPALTAEVIE